MRDFVGPIAGRVKEALDWAFVRKQIRHVSGPRMISLEKDEVALILLARNNGFFLEENIRHHVELGVKHIVYLDNGSTDSSLEIAKQFENVTTATCDANFRTHQIKMRHLANHIFTRGGWRLSIDCDELFDYPGSEHVKISKLANILRKRGHTCLVAQMLDLVPRCPLKSTKAMSFEQCIQAFDRYSLDGMTKISYDDPDGGLAYFLSKNVCENREIEIYYGGLRKLAFGENCCLTKHALFMPGPGVHAMAHPHVTTGVSIADFTAVLKHFKFAGDVEGRDRDLLRDNRLHDTVANFETSRRMDAFARDPSVDLSSFAPLDAPDPEKLIEQGFLVASPTARQFLGLD